MGWATPVHPVHPFAGDRPEGIDIGLNLHTLDFILLRVSTLSGQTIMSFIRQIYCPFDVQHTAVRGTEMSVGTDLREH